MKQTKSALRGFTLIELMIALVAGLVVALAAVAFVIASLKSNSEFVRSTRLEQELRTNLDFVVRDLRRAGFDQNALAYVNLPSSSTASSPFNQIYIISANGNRSCVIYTYDRLPGTAGTVDLNNGEIRAIRRVPSALTVNGVAVGVLEFAQSSAGRTPSCDSVALGASGGADYSTYPASCTSVANQAAGLSPWCPLSDSRVLNITSFLVDPASNISSSSMQIRDLKITMVGNLIKASDVSRSVQSKVRVRADCIRTTPGTNCIVAPTGT